MINDTNAQYLTQQLAEIGVDVFWISQVGDNLGRVVEVLDRASTRSDAVLITGGLGPTEDDLTREALAALMGETMAVDPDLERQLRELFARRGRPMPERNVKQATLIPAAQAVPNAIGTAPGWLVRRGGHVLAAMPGVPREMRLMWTEHVRPVLSEMAGASALVTTTLRILGAGESGVEERLGSLIHGTNPTVATYAKPDGVQVRISAKARDEQEARRLLAPVADEVRGLFGDSVFGSDEQPPGVLVAAELQRLRWTLASAEKGTAGALAAEISGDAALAPYFRSGFVIGNGGAPFGVEVTSALEMAAAARLKVGADIGVAILLLTEGLAADCAVSIGDRDGTGASSWNRGVVDLDHRSSVESLALVESMALLLKALKEVG
ncbi:MAG: hypothetical protein A3K13_05200 [Gemmatimonadetes bacterium RIFCSPLOWO2_12_FULL_68_9]|nr:MAG: hypothetical protein A3K13_05200 [Gemmatimonadetes bacterium RIFCSPLOWO2_12_FULL_68_9]